MTDYRLRVCFVALLTYALVVGALQLNPLTGQVAQSALALVGCVVVARKLVKKPR